MFGIFKKKEVKKELKADLYGINEFRTYFSEVGVHLGDDFIEAINAHEVNSMSIGGYLKHYVFECYMQGISAEQCVAKINSKFSTMFML